MVGMTFRPAARAALAALATAFAVSIHAQQADVSAANSKLTTVLADLVNASAGNNTLAATTGAARPRSVADAMQSGRLRVDGNNAAQVYILMSAVTDETVRQLTDAGVTVEISDAARRRVQARVPVASLTRVAQLVTSLSS